MTSIHTFESSPSTVWRAWLSPESLVSPVTRIRVDPRVGGRIVLESVHEGTISIMTGSFIQVQAPRHLEYTWQWDGRSEQTIVSVQFHPAGEHTVVEVEHRGFLEPTSLERHRSGWSSYLAGLAAYL